MRLMNHHRLLGSLTKVGFTIMKKVTKPLAKSVLMPLGLTVAGAGAADAEIYNLSMLYWELQH